MIRAVIFDMGGTLMRFVRPGSGSWREFETPGIRGIYRYLIEQGHPIASHEDDFVEAMFARLAEGWQQSTGGHISLRAVDWIAAGAADHALTLDEAALLEAARRYALPIREGLRAADGAASDAGGAARAGLPDRADLEHDLAGRAAYGRSGGDRRAALSRAPDLLGRDRHVEAEPADLPTCACGAGGGA